MSITAVAACFCTHVFSADAAKSMRGTDVSASDSAAEEKTYVGKRPGTQPVVVRTFSTQPPLIPHAVDNLDEISLEGNQCMDCHSGANFKKNAPKTGDSHFFDREGNKLEEASALRYNCAQRHVPQVDAPPLVENDFKGNVPKDWGHKMVRKIKASAEVYGKIMGTIDTKEKFGEHRLRLASNEWKRMKESDSRECRNCHTFEAMDIKK